MTYVWVIWSSNILSKASVTSSYIFVILVFLPIYPIMSRPQCKILSLWGYIQESLFLPLGDLPRIGKIKYVKRDLHKQDYFLGGKAEESTSLLQSRPLTTFFLVEWGVQPFPVAVCNWGSQAQSFPKGESVSLKRSVKKSKQALHRLSPHSSDLPSVLPSFGYLLQHKEIHSWNELSHV